MSLLLTITLKVFKIRKRGEKIINVEGISSNLSSDLLENVDILRNYKQSKIA